MVKTKLHRIQGCLNGSAETAGASHFFKELGAQVENWELNEGARRKISKTAVLRQ